MAEFRYAIILSALGLLLGGCGRPPVVSTSVAELDFGTSSSLLTFNLYNSGGGGFDWTISVDADWLEVLPQAGRTSRDTVQVIVKANRARLVPAEYKGMVIIKSSDSTVSLPVRLIRLENPQVMIQTSMGDITVELFPDVAPRTVENFLGLCKKNFYDSLIFHRVIDGFMIQGGGYNDKLELRKTGYFIPAEFNDSLHHEGSLGMARMRNPNTGSSQFYICLTPQPDLDGRYTVFGNTIAGMDVVKAIGKVKTSGSQVRPSPTALPDCPLKPIYILKTIVLKDYQFPEANDSLSSGK